MTMMLLSKVGSTILEQRWTEGGVRSSDKNEPEADISFPRKFIQISPLPKLFSLLLALLEVWGLLTHP